uniref:Uncharacterized protein n=1 Tax=Thermogemmatispora argillosa TaxID=2045280 RepID=A0A455SYM7_9CHLR|nr:hypothetical protein KTA_16460 [Thermogemmatispora argillosa]
MAPAELEALAGATPPLFIFAAMALVSSLISRSLDWLPSPRPAISRERLTSAQQSQGAQEKGGEAAPPREAAG